LIRQNDKAWEKYFQETLALQEIEQRGYTYVAASDLKTKGRREARLMTKLDSLASRPQVFKRNKLTIFSTKNGEYIIFKDPDKRSYFEFGDQLESIPIQQYNSRIDLKAFNSYPRDQNFNEAQAIDFAFISSLIKTFTGDESIQLTIRGRSYTGNFGFHLPNTHHYVKVSSVQIEIDAGYEGNNAIYLIEAKAGKKKDFHIRQLYYPYLEWSNRSQKTVIPIFFVYSNGKYYLTEFLFGKEFGDLKIVRTKSYTINESPTLPLNISKLLQQVPEGLEPRDVPYPQADDLDKVVDTVKLIGSGVNDKAQISDFFDFTERQSDYYANAGCYLDLVQREGHHFALTQLGKEFVQLETLAKRTEMLITQLLTRPTFRTALNLLVENNLALERIDKKDIEKIIQSHTHLARVTQDRRASTVRSWLKWILDNCQIITT
jgi:hypothetical protein